VGVDYFVGKVTANLRVLAGAGIKPRVLLHFSNILLTIYLFSFYVATLQ
jgi:hypothetical protein